MYLLPSGVRKLLHLYVSEAGDKRTTHGLPHRVSSSKETQDKIERHRLTLLFLKNGLLYFVYDASILLFRYQVRHGTLPLSFFLLWPCVHSPLWARIVDAEDC